MSIAYTVSIDKIKFKGKLCKAKKLGSWQRTKIRAWCENRSVRYDVVAFPESFKEFHYRYSYTLTPSGEKEGAFYIAEWYNGEFKEQREKPDAFLVEYNPNKGGASIFRDFCDCFVFRITEFCFCDLAYDVPNVDIKDVLLDTICDVMTYGKTSNATHYIAPKEDGSGRVKVYQKDKERERVGEEKEKTLRIEISLKGSVLNRETINNNNYINNPTKVNKEYATVVKCVERLNSVKIAVAAPELDGWKAFALSKLSPEDFQKCLGMMTFKTRSKYKNISFDTRYDTLDIDVFTFIAELHKALAPWERWRKVGRAV